MGLGNAPLLAAKAHLNWAYSPGPRCWRRSANRRLGNRKRKDGPTEWILPPQLECGQARVNNFHLPERYLWPDDEDRDDAVEDG